MPGEAPDEASELIALSFSLPPPPNLPGILESSLQICSPLSSWRRCCPLPRADPPAQGAPFLDFTLEPLPQGLVCASGGQDPCFAVSVAPLVMVPRRVGYIHQRSLQAAERFPGTRFSWA